MEKLTSLEKKWIYYDIGNSAFILLATTIIPIVFNNLAKASLNESTYLAFWGYATSFATIIVSILSPFLGLKADILGKRKTFFIYFAFIGIIALSILPFTKNYLLFLFVYVFARIGFNGSLVFYDSMLKDITTPKNMDKVSSYGYAWGYIGSCIPFIISIAIVMFKDRLGLTTNLSITLSFLITSIWWFIFTVPIAKSYKQISFRKIEENGKVNILLTLKKIYKDKKIFFFLLSFFFYIDGVYTIINMATAYGQSLGLSSNGLIMALLVTQIVAFPFAILFAKLSKKFKNSKLILICILSYTSISIFAIFLDSLLKFWILAIVVGMFQGGIQALSRSYFAKIIPAENSGEFFGFYDICGKGASIIGTLLVSVISQLTGSQSKGILILPIMFFLGIIFFKNSLNSNKNTNL